MPGSSSCFSKVFGTSLKPPYSSDDPDVAATCSRIDDTKKFLNWSWWPLLTPWAKSSIFSRRGYHIKVFVYFLWGICALIGNLATNFNGNSGAYIFQSTNLSISGKLLTFMLSSYVSVLVNVVRNVLFSI